MTQEPSTKLPFQNRTVVIKVSGFNPLLAKIISSDQNGILVHCDQLWRVMLQSFTEAIPREPVVFVPLHQVEWIVVSSAT